MWFTVAILLATVAALGRANLQGPPPIVCPFNWNNQYFFVNNSAGGFPDPASRLAACKLNGWQVANVTSDLVPYLAGVQWLCYGSNQVSTFDFYDSLPASYGCYAINSTWVMTNETACQDTLPVICEVPSVQTDHVNYTLTNTVTATSTSYTATSITVPTTVTSTVYDPTIVTATLTQGTYTPTTTTVTTSKCLPSCTGGQCPKPTPYPPRPHPPYYGKPEYGSSGHSPYPPHNHPYYPPHNPYVNNSYGGQPYNPHYYPPYNPYVNNSYGDQPYYYPPHYPHVNNSYGDQPYYYPPHYPQCNNDSYGDCHQCHHGNYDRPSEEGYYQPEYGNPYYQYPGMYNGSQPYPVVYYHHGNYSHPYYPPYNPSYPPHGNPWKQQADNGSDKKKLLSPQKTNKKPTEVKDALNTWVECSTSINFYYLVQNTNPQPNETPLEGCQAAGGFQVANLTSSILDNIASMFSSCSVTAARFDSWYQYQAPCAFASPGAASFFPDPLDANYAICQGLNWTLCYGGPDVQVTSSIFTGPYNTTTVTATQLTDTTVTINATVTDTDTFFSQTTQTTTSFVPATEIVYSTTTNSTQTQTQTCTQWQHCYSRTRTVTETSSTTKCPCNKPGTSCTVVTLTTTTVKTVKPRPTCRPCHDCHQCHPYGHPHYHGHHHNHTYGGHGYDQSQYPSNHHNYHYPGGHHDQGGHSSQKSQHDGDNDN